MLKKTLALAAMSTLLLPAHALTTGDLAFTAFNADEDGWSLVTFVDIAAGTTVYFTDNEWGGSAFNSGESYHQWVSGGATIAAGTVIRFTNIDTAALAASVGTLTRAAVTGNTNYGISASEESIYIYQAANPTAAPTFLGAITSTAFGTASAGVLTNTGLAIGSGAVALGGGAEYDQYIGARSGLASFAAYQPLVSDITRWTDNPVDGTYATQVPDTTPFSITAVPEPGTTSMLLAGLIAVGFMSRRRA
jgi:hypothetical protein